ncbi:MAG: Fe-S cluster assembly ATPase SufC [Gammaproteobacteria bacterium RIFCSPHIGHO2_12_FULL_38_14]|nr:MAG: Fe-S cluster assembly ATPase SufC [Gammaproteobacteria bacterium RIFCSPHIGHO2_12_FULL_38_14]
MLEINQLHVSIQDEKQNIKEILRGVNLHIKPGEVHAIMGPNGSGKSTLANVLAGRADYRVQSGKVLLNHEDLLSLEPEARASRGMFLAFQYPTEIPGVNNMYFLRTALNSLRKQKNLPPYDAADFLSLVKNKMKEVGLAESFLHRAVNEGFSGGEKKRNEVLQMLVLEPSFIMLDETDSGLDIDALQIVGRAVNSLRDGKRSFLVVTHYQRLLDYIEPDVVHVMAHGRILKSGDKSLAKDLEISGYSWIESELKQ